jgi:hypothetical protein
MTWVKEKMRVPAKFREHLPPHLLTGMAAGCKLRWLHGVVMITPPPSTSYPETEHWYRGFRIERVRGLRNIRWGWRGLRRSISINPPPLSYYPTLESIRGGIDIEIAASDLTAGYVVPGKGDLS